MLHDVNHGVGARHAFVLGAVLTSSFRSRNLRWATEATKLTKLIVFSDSTIDYYCGRPCHLILVVILIVLLLALTESFLTWPQLVPHLVPVFHS